MTWPGLDKNREKGWWTCDDSSAAWSRRREGHRRLLEETKAGREDRDWRCWMQELFERDCWRRKREEGEGCGGLSMCKPECAQSKQCTRQAGARWKRQGSKVRSHGMRLGRTMERRL